MFTTSLLFRQPYQLLGTRLRFNCTVDKRMFSTYLRLPNDYDTSLYSLHIEHRMTTQPFTMR
jgi:hypothetical protein